MNVLILPAPVLTEIFRNLSLYDIFSAALTCRAWFEAFDSASLWKTVKFEFHGSPQNIRKLFRFIEKYGSYFQNVELHIDQSNPVHRHCAIEVLQRLAFIPDRQIIALKLIFVGVNPLFYGGQEFLPALQVFFASAPPGMVHKKTLTTVDFSKFQIMLRDEVLQLLAMNHPMLTMLDIQNKQLICKVTSDCIHTVVQCCRHLTDLRLYHASLDDRVLMAMPETLKHLSIVCLRQEHCDLSELAWLHLLNANPQVTVTLKFHYLTPLWMYREVLKSVIPLRNLHLQSFTMIAEEVEIALDIFANKLKTIYITSQPSEELDESVLKIASSCDYLEQLHVFCSLDKSTIEKVLALKPKMAINQDCYTLKTVMERPPDLADAIIDEIQSKWK